jgi:hypothetical protein
MKPAESTVEPDAPEHRSTVVGRAVSDRQS